MKQTRKCLNDTIPGELRNLGMHSVDKGMIAPYSFNRKPSGMYDLNGDLTEAAVFAWWAALNRGVWGVHHPNNRHDCEQLLAFLSNYGEFGHPECDPRALEDMPINDKQTQCELCDCPPIQFPPLNHVFYSQVINQYFSSCGCHTPEMCSIGPFWSLGATLGEAWA